ncbi:hypothetical protein ACHAW6_005329 [Cyclotella cf. meneghiniana]
MVSENIIIPGHSTVSTFLHPNTSNYASSVNVVSIKNLFNVCLPSLSKALDPSNFNQNIWMKSYMETKGGLESLKVYERINKITYLALHCSDCITKALPSMCDLVFKHVKDDNPLWANSRIFILGNFEDRMYNKSQCYTPVEGDCKNVFCNADLPHDELTVVHPPVKDFAYAKGEYWLLKKSLLRLCHVPHHWYNMITAILKDIGLTPNPHDPYLYSGVINSDDAPPLSTCKPVHIGNVDNFIFF